MTTGFRYYRFLSLFFVTCIAFGAATASAADAYEFVTLDPPGATACAASGINDHSDIVGDYQDGTGQHGFLLVRDVYAAIDFPGAAATRARGINNRGDIVGEYDDIDGVTHGFVVLRRGGRSTTLPVDYPDAVATYAEGINEHGDIAGAYLDDSNELHGFADEDGDFSTIEVPGSTWTGANGINDKGVIVGAYQTDIYHGFTVYKDRLGLLDHPDGEYGTSCIGINSHGDIVGWYGVTSGEHGFLLHKGEYSNIDVPDARSTYAWGINGRRDIVGVFVDDLGNQHGFLARAK